MVILGLTGSIAMGKSTAAGMFQRLGVPVFDADACVHELLAEGGGGVAAVEAAFPEVVRQGAVDRRRLADRVFACGPDLRRLEAILHPLVRRGERRFLEIAARNRRTLVVLDVPLLLETGGERRCDRVAVVTAPRYVQLQRLLARPGMTAERVRATLSRQMSDADKRRRADFVIQSGLGRGETLRTIGQIVRRCRDIPGTKWPPPTRSGRRTGHA
ncbi:MAG: dephospho-CoA kinase [Rhodospirillales bacterium]|nr:dephospho-CoA kinase [Rhodospirillales bacterium]